MGELTKRFLTAVFSVASHGGVILKRTVAVAAGLTAVYVLVGSWVYGDWWFAFFWRGRFHEVEEQKSALLDAVTVHPYLTVSVLLTIFFVALRAYTTREMFLPKLDRLWAWVVLASVFSIAITAVLVFERNKESYARWEKVEEALANLEVAMKELRSFGEIPPIEPPIDFHFLDRERINSLYSQLEPEMIERQRIVAATGVQSGKVGIATGPAEAQLGVSKESSSQSSFERVPFSAERKCVDLVKYLLQAGQAKYYADSSNWYMRRLVKNYLQVRANVRTKFAGEEEEIDFSKLPPLKTIDQPPTKQEKEKAEREVNKSQEEFHKELESLSGLVLLDGVFRFEQKEGQQLVLVKELTSKPKKIVFRVYVPLSARSALPFASGATSFRIFGNVTSPLDSNGVIAVRVLAIF